MEVGDKVRLRNSYISRDRFICMENELGIITNVSEELTICEIYFYKNVIKPRILSIRNRNDSIFEVINDNEFNKRLNNKIYYSAIIFNNQFIKYNIGENKVVSEYPCLLGRIEGYRKDDFTKIPAFCSFDQILKQW